MMMRPASPSPVAPSPNAIQLSSPLAATFLAALSPPWWVHALVSLPLMIIPCLLALHPIKGWLVASQYVNKAQEAGTEALWAKLNARAKE